MKELIKYFALVIVALPLLLGCGSQIDDDPTPKPNSTTGQTEYRCVLEVWTNIPAKYLHFWGCTWKGDLAQDGKPIVTGQKINVLTDLKTHYSLEKMYYKTEFIASHSNPELFVFNFWIYPKDGYTPFQNEGLKVTYKAQYYRGNKLVKTEEEQNFLVGILGQNFQITGEV